MLAARALGIGSIPTTLHPSVMTRVYTLFGVPAELTFHFCIPLGYPAEGARFGGSRRRPTRETTYLDHWGAPVPWTWTRADRAIAPWGAARDEPDPSAGLP